MYYTVYKVTNTINHKIYIGVHATLDLNDGYLGSGTAILKAIKKYGKDNFYKEILFVYDSLQEALDTESEIVTEDFCSQSNVYNITSGGGIPPSKKGKLILQTKQILKGNKRTPAQKLASKKHSERMKNRSPWNKGKQNPSSWRAIKTPDGVFKSIADASKYYNLTDGTIVHRCKKQLYGFMYCEK